MAEDMGQGDQAVDEAGATVLSRFKDFLTDFRPKSVHALDVGGGEGNPYEMDMMVDTSDAELTTQQRLTYDYVAQLAAMAAENKTTLFVNFQHVVEKDAELAEAIELEYYRFEPFLRQAVDKLISEIRDADGSAQAFNDSSGPKPEYAVSFYALSRVERIRAMKTDKIGRLMSISGTVTRSSDVR
jgi:DNA replication licensing factor MCM6